MIYDTLNNLPNYLGVSDNLDTVIEYVMARDINTLPTGKSSSSLTRTATASTSRSAPPGRASP